LLTWGKKLSLWEENEVFKGSDGGVYPSTTILGGASRNFWLWVGSQMGCGEGKGIYGEGTTEAGHTGF